jgi:hypothetical protein
LCYRHATTSILQSSIREVPGVFPRNLGKWPELPTFNEDDGRNALVASKYEKRMDSPFWEKAVAQLHRECPDHSLISDFPGI